MEPDAEKSGFASAITATSGNCHASVRPVARAPRSETEHASAAEHELVKYTRRNAATEQHDEVAERHDGMVTVERSGGHGTHARHTT